MPPGLSIEDPTTTAFALAVLTGLFGLRVAGQYLVSTSAPSWLPPMPEWYSGVIPYPRLLAIQLAMLAVMTVVVLGLASGMPAFTEARPELGTLLLIIAWPYAASMAVRYVVRMWRHPEARWTGRTIPIVFHLVLATWLFFLGSYLRPVA